MQEPYDVVYFRGAFSKEERKLLHKTILKIATLFSIELKCHECNLDVCSARCQLEAVREFICKFRNVMKRLELLLLV